MNSYIYTNGNLYIQIDDYKTSIPATVTISEFEGKPSTLATVTYPTLNEDLEPEKKSYVLPEEWIKFKDDINAHWQASSCGTDYCELGD